MIAGRSARRAEYGGQISQALDDMRVRLPAKLLSTVPTPESTPTIPRDARTARGLKVKRRVSHGHYLRHGEFF